MRSRLRWLLVAMTMLVAAATVLPASADHATRPSQNMQALGHSPHVGALSPAPANINSDLAFWGDRAFNGNYNGWRTIDISNPNAPVQINYYNNCTGDQGDIVVWENILVRSWNSPATAGQTCGGAPVPVGFEGLHVFDITNVSAPVLRASVALECGSHTATVAGVEGGNLIVWSNNSSSSGCVDGNQANDDPAGDFMDIVSVPISNPAGAALVRREPLQGPTTAVRTGCHDAGVILLDINKAACASADTINVWDIGANNRPGGSLTDPDPMFTITEPGVGQAGTNGRWHSAAFTWDGRVLIAGWEPGGGTQAECEAGDPAVDKSFFFYDANTGAKLGQWVLPRPQGPDENCTIHNYNVIPMRNDRYILAGGHYQAGTWVLDFTNPAAAQVLAWSDPVSLGPGSFCTNTNPPGCQLGGAWSSYWYNDHVYESDITKGLNVFRVASSVLDPTQTIDLSYLNPQTQMGLPPDVLCKGAVATHVGTNEFDVITGTPGVDVIVALGGDDLIYTRKGDDVVCTGNGRDKVYGSGGNDFLLGQNGRDNLRGGGGSDRLAGGRGRPDRCHGGGGLDTIARSCEKIIQP